MKLLKKRSITFLCICICVIGATHCSKKQEDQSNTARSVEQVMDEQINSEKGNDQKDAKNTENVQNEVEKSNEDDSSDSDSDVDYDLTQMDSDMVYATIYQLMVDPDDYIGKTFRIKGTYYAAENPNNEEYYHCCIIKDAMACCAQGLEFVWGDGSHAYPDEYPAEDAEIEVQGTLEAYKEKNDDTTYCRLANADMKIIE